MLLGVARRRAACAAAARARFSMSVPFRPRGAAGAPDLDDPDLCLRAFPAARASERASERESERARERERETERDRER